MDFSDTAANEAHSPRAAGWQDTLGYEVLTSGPFLRAAVSTEYRPGRAHLEPSAEAVIGDAWQTYLRASTDAGIVVYNGGLFRLDSFQHTGDRLPLGLSDTDFRACIGTASAAFTSVFPDLPRANPLSVSVVLVTCDSKIVIEKRNRVDARRRPYHVVAGYMERDRETGREPHPFDTLEREVREELGVDLDGSRLFATGLVRTMYGSEICFCCPLTQSFDRLLEMQAGSGTDSEIEALQHLDDSPRAVAAFLVAHAGDLVPSGRACLLLYGRVVYGLEWYDAALGRRQGETAR